MNDKRKLYWLWAAIGLLLCLNLGTIGWIAFRTHAPRRPDAPNADAYLARWLRFDPGQRSRYQQYRRALRTAQQPHQDSLRTLRRELFGQLGQPAASQPEIEALVQRIERQHGQLTRLQFRHWQQVRALCTPGQRPRFDRWMDRLVKTMDQPRPRERRRDQF